MTSHASGAIQDILDLERARTIEDVDETYLRILEHVNTMHLMKLKDLEREITHRLGVESAVAQSGPMTSAPMTQRERPEDR